MKKNSIQGYAGTRGIKAATPAGLERSCEAAATDGIVQAPATSSIERIEARFHGQGFEPHRHDTYAIGVTLAGVQTFHYRGSTRASLPGKVIVLHPDELHDGSAGTDDGLRYRMLYLPPERLIEATGSASLPFVRDPVLADDEFRQCLAEALDDLEAEPQDLLMDDLIARLSSSIWRHADVRDPASSSSLAREAVLRCRDYLQDNCSRLVSSQELEAVSGLDRYTTARQFRRLLGTSPHRYLLMRRLDRSKALMAAGSSLADVAADAGFADQAHFTRHFKKTFGMPPGRWMALTKAV
ncbi:AraC family transcriptional regulator [Rhizobium deserti]|uniref:AraC family transcriptional regulator n=1 Tax=Rhizobium deserti TaxID=2547961 RepID=A0A4R5UJN4_9HYPH|nr:AraC family transcriptional regulator [Rhizobium deserti]TDK37066.1 AraC family transcriptional regulator [Rhizobium deserti]